jgi:hypothetical protein
MSDYDRWKTRSDLDDWAAQNQSEEEVMSDHYEFSVIQFFEDGSWECVRRFVGPEEAVKAAHHYTHSVASKLGIVERVIITDGGDDCVFEWKAGEGVTFPPPPLLRSQ